MPVSLAERQAEMRNRGIAAVADLSGDQHVAPKDLAARWGLSLPTIRDLFAEEQGVLKVITPNRVTLRIPESVARRVSCAAG